MIPPHLAEQVATRCEIIAIRDEFAKQRLRDGVYLPGEIDRKWGAPIEADFIDVWTTIPVRYQYPGLPSLSV